jgi:nitrogen fixation NifU-like protein
MSDTLYDDHILRQFREPYHRGRVQNPKIVHEEENAFCGDRVHLELLLDGIDRIREAWFDGHGCAISQAAASILAHHVEGRTIPELKAFQAAQMLELLRVRLTPTRQKCGLLAFNVLKTMLAAR